RLAPEGAEAAPQARRRRDPLPRHDARAPWRAPLPRELELEGRNVHEDVGVAELPRDPAPALEVQLDLPDAVDHGDVEGGERFVVHNAPGLETHERLIPLHRSRETGVER